METVSSFKEKISNQIKDKYPDFEREWTEFVNGMGDKLISALRKGFERQLRSFENLLNISLTIVVDNNFVFGNIQNAIRKESKIENSFIYKMGKNEFIKLYAPDKLREELHAKIHEHLAEDEDKAIGYANTILEYITIKDALWVDEWRRANNLIGHIDQDDVPYLALAFNLGSHSIVSYDKVFQNQNDVQIWDQKELNRIVTNYNSGTVAFLVLGTSAIIIYQVLKFIFFILKILFDAIVHLLYSVVYLVSKIPLPLLAIGGIAVALFYSESEEFREIVNDIKDNGNEWLENKKRELDSLTKRISKFLKDFNTLHKQNIKEGFDFFGFLLLEYTHLNEEIKKIELKKAS